ncbi:uncharacterized protein sgpp1a isoform 1-T1 [Salvelinus alpinus]|uniref:uncharacterized protein sgpp1a isoform X1 n=1 Tax=Salvelinus alpinus TaxID=8036 RepID=UPI0039FD1D45
MAKDLKTMFIRCCGYLQDPHHVASFQKLCGVQGSFPVKLSRKEWENEFFVNGACVKRHQDQSGNGEGHVGGQQIEGPLQRKSVTAGEQHNDCSNKLQHGTALVSGIGETTEQQTVSHEGNRQSSGGRLTGKLSKAVESDRENGDSSGRVKPLRRNSLTGDVGQEFIIQNKFLFYLFTFGSELGNEMFFIVFFPFLIWNVDAFVSRRILVVWIWNLFLGQSTKDIVRWTRPASPPVVKVEVFYNSEYSMPSTHAMSGTAIPFSLFLLTYGRWQYPFLFGLSLAICWSFLVCVSRVYMGMHSVLVVNRISACLADISVWMTDHHLKLNLGKTELLFLPGKDCPFHDLAITVDNSIVSSSQSAKNLGVILDNTLSFSTNIKAVTRSCRFMLYNIRRVRPCLTQEAAQVLIQALVISRLDYCNSLLAGLPACAIKPLQLIQNAAARLVFNFPKFSHVTPLLRSLHWLPVEARIRYKTMVLAYGAVRGTAPPYLQALIRPYTQTRALRSSTSGLLASLPLRKYSSRSAQSKLFAALAPQWWNKLPHDARSAESITTFRRHLKPHLFKEYLG